MEEICKNEIYESKKAGLNDSILNVRPDEVQWSIMNGNVFYPVAKTTKNLPTGFYEVDWNDKVGVVLSYKKINTEKLFKLSDNVVDIIIDDIERFWKNEKIYNKYEFIYKRGILLYGPPGNGKTCIIELLSNELIERHSGIIIFIKDTKSLDFLMRIVQRILYIENNRKMIFVIEDIDSLIVEREAEGLLINFLDGNSRINNVVTIATTNYPEKLKERITNRPSRFDRRYEILPPNANTRKLYLQKILKKDIESINITEWIKDTEGFSLDHLKELVISVFVLEYEYNEALEAIRDIKNNRGIKSSIITDGPKKLNGFKPGK